MAMERIVVISDVIRSFLGVLMGGAIALYMIYVGGQLIMAGHSLAGFESIGVAIATGVGPFLIRNYLQSKERQAQQAALPGRR